MGQWCKGSYESSLCVAVEVRISPKVQGLKSRSQGTGDKDRFKPLGMEDRVSKGGDHFYQS